MTVWKLVLLIKQTKQHTKSQQIITWEGAVYYLGAHIVGPMDVGHYIIGGLMRYVLRESEVTQQLTTQH